MNFSQAVYSAEEVDGMMIITLQADGFSIWPYSVEVNPMEIGGPSKQILHSNIVMLYSIKLCLRGSLGDM